MLDASRAVYVSTGLRSTVICTVCFAATLAKSPPGALDGVEIIDGRWYYPPGAMGLY
jgi:hypothetical protein